MRDDLVPGVIVGVGGCLVALVTVVALAIVNPILLAAGGYFTGWVLSSVAPGIGDWVVRGAQVFKLEIALNQLPVIGAFLGFAGSFFKSSQTNTNSAKK